MSGAEQSASRPSSADFPTGAFMKMSFTYKHADARELIEKEIGHHAAKLNKLLKTYQPDLPRLHGVISKEGHSREGHAHAENLTCALTLYLPSHTMHATGTSAKPRASCKIAFAELEAQLKKHKALLRKDYEWKRKRTRAPAPAVTS
jgi:ribosome-associated translation inhibitor RaiA